MPPIGLEGHGHIFSYVLCASGGAISSWAKGWSVHLTGRLWCCLGNAQYWNAVSLESITFFALYTHVALRTLSAIVTYGEVNTIPVTFPLSEQVEHPSQYVQCCIFECCSCFLWACGPATTARVTLGRVNLSVVTKHCVCCVASNFDKYLLCSGEARRTICLWEVKWHGHVLCISWGCIHLDIKELYWQWPLIECEVLKIFILSDIPVLTWKLEALEICSSERYQTCETTEV